MLSYASDPPTKPIGDMLCTVMVLVRGTLVNGMSYWAYMCIRPSFAARFKEARDSGKPFDLEEFGTIIEHGEGQVDPPGEVKLRMETEFGMRHDGNDDLLKAIEKHAV